MRKQDMEPDFVKIYTKKWKEYNDIPTSSQAVFLVLLKYMSPCDASTNYTLEFSQTVHTGMAIGKEIQKILGIEKRQYQNGLRALCQCGAIRKISRGFYQVNPNYATKGSWEYNEKKHTGGARQFVEYYNKITA